MTAASQIPEFQALTTASGSHSPGELVARADLLARWRLEVQRALSKHHFVTVASALASSCGVERGSLEALGLPVDLLDCFPDWQHGSREPFRPPETGLTIAPAGAGVPLGTIRLQLSPTPGAIPYSLLLLRGALQSFDRAARFIAIVEPGADLEALGRLVERFAPQAQARVRFVPLACITVFAQDNALAMRDRRGQPVLLVPRAFRANQARAEDALDPEEAARALGVEVRRSRLHWEGGNIVHDDGSCFAGVDSVAENTSRLGLSPGETLGILGAELGVPVATLGRLEQSRFDAIENRTVTSGQASFHLDLDVALLGRFGRARRPRALVADAARGLDFMDDVLAVRRLVEGHFLPARDMRRHLRAEYEASASTRHPLLLEYASTLEEHGYRVTGMPDLRIDPRMDVFRRVNLDFGFCNVISGLRANRPAVHHFVSGVRRLDADAATQMRLAGVEPVVCCNAEVASALMLRHGGLHCCCGSL
jgi:hypothetical protein